MHKKKKRDPKNSCFNCQWEPVWYQSGDGFEGRCRCQDGKDTKIMFQDDVLQCTNDEGSKGSDACPRWSSSVS